MNVSSSSVESMSPKWSRSLPSCWVSNKNEQSQPVVGGTRRRRRSLTGILHTQPRGCFGAHPVFISELQFTCRCHLLPHKQKFSGQIKTRRIDRAAGRLGSRQEAPSSAGSEASGGALMGVFEGDDSGGVEGSRSRGSPPSSRLPSLQLSITPQFPSCFHWLVLCSPTATAAPMFAAPPRADGAGRCSPAAPSPASV